MNIAKELQLATDLCGTGKLAEAAALCRNIIKRQPRNAVALNMLGVIAYNGQRFEEAIELIGKAIAVQKTHEFYCNLGLPLQSLGRFSEAIAAYSQAIALKPDFADAYHNMGDALYKQGLVDGAISCFRFVVSLKPESVEPHFILANLLASQGKAEEAIPILNRALELETNPQAQAKILVNLANLLKTADRTAEAITTYGRALKLNPENHLAYLNMASVLLELNRNDEAMGYLERTIALEPSSATAYANMAAVYNRRDLFETSIEYSRKAIALDPGNVNAYSNLGACLASLGRFDESELNLRKAIELQPDFDTAHYNLGNLLRFKGEPDAALASYDNTLALKPDYVEAHWNRSLMLLARGDLEQGWKGYEWRWKLDYFAHKNRRPYPYPFWEGGPLDDKTILVWTEQGVGDDMMFASVFPDVIARCRHCVIETEHRLVSLYARSFPKAEVVARLGPPHERTLQADIQLQIASGSLPRFLRPTLDSFPQHHGYLRPDPQRVEFWKQRVKALGGGLKVGISWRSRLSQKVRDIHYTELTEWGPIFAVPGINFINLQYDDCREEIAEAKARFGIEVHAWDDIDLHDDFDEAAALTASMDLMISIGNAAASIAGGIGKPLWLMTLEKGWPMLGTDHFPWEPNTRVFSKSADESWDAVIKQVAQELAALSGSSAK